MMMKLSLVLLALSAVSYSTAFLVPPAARHHETVLKNGMDAYDAQMRALAAGQPIAVGGNTAPATAPAPAPAQPAMQASTSAASAGDPIATLEASQKATVDAIAAAIPDLVAKPDLSFTGETIAGSAAALDGRDAVGNSNVAWLASLTVANKESSLTIFNGPLTNVPHLLSRCCLVGGDAMQFVLDFRPRAYGAYEMKDAQGNYPGPEELGRQAFEYSGNRMEFFNNFGTDEVQAFLESTKASFQGAVEDMSNQNNELDMLTKGPLVLALTMPATDANVAAVAAAREQAANYWLTWALDGAFQHRPGAPVNTQYVYDTKYKQNCYGALLPVYSALYGPDDGAKLTAAVSGPLDEAYVGGGS
ncbi:expressed unknown protein [Seminavis robusta]|uniref:Uncharacterized protein n=1 Tax=Seminavis robusta TaxID=568900 RepID=A0A9N8DNN6_9STRA|nr:expressed unknown protein [Seminavis robusta]|eukprot:Sro180_g078780.1 n/a (361) ;mRNA; r:56850-57932